MSTTLHAIEAATDPDHPLRTVGYIIAKLISVGFGLWGMVRYVRHLHNSRQKPPRTAQPPTARRLPPPGRAWPPQHYGGMAPRVPPHYGQHPAPSPAYRPRPGHTPAHPTPQYHHPDSTTADHGQWMRPQK